MLSVLKQLQESAAFVIANADARLYTKETVPLPLWTLLNIQELNNCWGNQGIDAPIVVICSKTVHGYCQWLLFMLCAHYCNL